MKVLLWITAALLALFSALHVVVTYEHWHQAGPARESVIVPAFVAVLAAVLALWVARRASRARPSA